MAVKNFGLLCYRTEVKSSVASVEPLTTDLLPEIHLNIWEQETKSSESDEAFLDIGLMFNLQETADTIELIFPWKVQKKDLIDLTSIIATPDAVPAIFNESWAVGAQQDDYVVYDPKNGGNDFALVNINDGGWSDKVHIAKWGSGASSRSASVDSISINVQELIKRAKRASVATNHSIARLYTRFRVLNIRKDFYCVGVDDGGLDISTVLRQKTEDIDFRLNVRRGAPPNLEKDLGRFAEFSKVHLFLMRSRDKDIVYQDKLFKSARSLEDEVFWARYSLKSATGSAEECAANLKRVKNSLGYQWKSGGNNEPVKEFGTLARFRMVKVAMWHFIAGALVLGVAGNVVLDICKWAYYKVNPEGYVEAICVKAGQEFVLPKQACSLGVKVDNSKNRIGAQSLSRE